jgi:hypothetical protein
VIFFGSESGPHTTRYTPNSRRIGSRTSGDDAPGRARRKFRRLGLTPPCGNLYRDRIDNACIPGTSPDVLSSGISTSSGLGYGNWGALGPNATAHQPDRRLRLAAKRLAAKQAGANWRFPAAATIVRPLACLYNPNSLVTPYPRAFGVGEGKESGHIHWP